MGTTQQQPHIRELFPLHTLTGPARTTEPLTRETYHAQYPREAEVLDLFCAGNSVAEISYLLSEDSARPMVLKTVETHLRNIRIRLGAETRQDIPARAEAMGLLAEKTEPVVAPATTPTEVTTKNLIHLTPEQYTVLIHLGEHLSTKIIAELMHEDPRSISNWIQKLFNKTGIHDREILGNAMRANAFEIEIETFTHTLPDHPQQNIPSADTLYLQDFLGLDQDTYAQLRDKGLTFREIEASYLYMAECCLQESACLLELSENTIKAHRYNAAYKLKTAHFEDISARIYLLSHHAREKRGKDRAVSVDAASPMESIAAAPVDWSQIYAPAFD